MVPVPVTAALAPALLELWNPPPEVLDETLEELLPTVLELLERFGVAFDVLLEDDGLEEEDDGEEDVVLESSSAWVE